MYKYIGVRDCVITLCVACIYLTRRVLSKLVLQQNWSCIDGMFGIASYFVQPAYSLLGNSILKRPF